MPTNPYALLKESVNPIIESIQDEIKVTDDPLISILGTEIVTGIQTPEAGTLELYQFASAPRVLVGLKWVYATGTRAMAQGRIQLMKFTSQIRITEDELDRIEQNGMVNSIIARNIRNQIRDNNAYWVNQIQRWGVNRWKGVTTDPEYNDNFKSLFHSSSGGTISEPSDLNATAGTPLDLSSTVAVWGAAQTLNNVQTITQNALTGMTALDYTTKMALPVNKIYMGLHPKVAALFRTTYDKLNSSTGQLDNINMMQKIINSGITPAESVYFDDDADVLTDNATTQLTFFSDPQINYKIIIVPPPNAGEAWTNWDKGRTVNKAGDRETISYERHKKLEIGFLPQAYHLRTSATASSYFKPLFVVTIKLYDTVA